MPVWQHLVKNNIPTCNVLWVMPRVLVYLTLCHLNGLAKMVVKMILKRIKKCWSSFMSECHNWPNSCLPLFIFTVKKILNSFDSNHIQIMPSKIYFNWVNLFLHKHIWQRVYQSYCGHIEKNTKQTNLCSSSDLK